jgi:hypothetical protein
MARQLFLLLVDVGELDQDDEGCCCWASITIPSSMELAESSEDDDDANDETDRDEVESTDTPNRCHNIKVDKDKIIAECK